MERARTQRFTLVCLLLGLVVSLMLTGCERLEFGYTKIGDLVKNPSQYDGKEVKIKGKVIDVMKLLFLGLYTAHGRFLWCQIGSHEPARSSLR